MASRHENVYFDYPSPSMFMPMDIAKKLHNKPGMSSIGTPHLSPLYHPIRYHSCLRSTRFFFVFSHVSLSLVDDKDEKGVWLERC